MLLFHPRSLLRRRCALRSIALLLLALPFAAAPHLRAQAGPAASKTNDISVFAGYSYLRPDYGPFGDQGATFGLDLTRYFHFPIAPSLEARVNLDRGIDVNESTYLFGLKGQGTLKRIIHPYAFALIGPGTIHYNYPRLVGILGDNSTVFSAGAGIDADIARNFVAKFDYQGQRWKTGNNVTLSPSIFLVGVAYRIPFRARKQSNLY